MSKKFKNNLKTILFVIICTITMYSGADILGVSPNMSPEAMDYLNYQNSLRYPQNQVIYAKESTILETNLWVFVTGIAFIIGVTVKITIKLSSIDYKIQNVENDVSDIKNKCNANTCIANNILKEDYRLHNQFGKNKDKKDE